MDGDTLVGGWHLKGGMGKAQPYPWRMSVSVPFAPAPFAPAPRVKLRFTHATHDHPGTESIGHEHGADRGLPAGLFSRLP